MKLTKREFDDVTMFRISVYDAIKEAIPGTEFKFYMEDYEDAFPSIFGPEAGYMINMQGQVFKRVKIKIVFYIKLGYYMIKVAGLGKRNMLQYYSTTQSFSSEFKKIQKWADSEEL